MRVLARREGLLGPIRILERKSDGARLYCLKGSVQTMVQADGVSVFGYVHAAKLLLKSARTILMIGGGGGSLATMLARQGADVTVLEVDPAAEELVSPPWLSNTEFHPPRLSMCLFDFSLTSSFFLPPFPSGSSSFFSISKPGSKTWDSPKT